MLDPNLFALSTIGVLSFCLGLLAFAPYLRDTLAGRTKPQRSSWLIWAVVASIALASQVAEGASHSLWFTTANWLMAVAVFGVAIRHGSGGGFARRDRVSLAAAFCILLLWYLTETAALALALAILVNCLGAWLTIQKAYLAPHSETLTTWGLAAVAAGLGAVSVGRLDPVLIAYPLFLLALRGTVVAAILLGRARRNAAVPARLSGAERIQETSVV